METNFYKKSRRLKHCYKIVGKNSKIFPFIKNKAQEVVAEKIKELRNSNQGKKKTPAPYPKRQTTLNYDLRLHQ